MSSVATRRASGATVAEAVVRPSGRTYRAKRSPHAEMLDGGDWYEPSVIVWRTHDIDVAVALAGEEWRRDSGDPFPTVIERGWFRSVPWDVGGIGCDRSVIDGDPERDTPGVMFRHPYSQGSAR